ncbi:MAG: A/G-specific adenine glycosylase [Thiotrichales bacterium 12-47-6]|nr:MAG: A/G-specific adenine glycosylase [Thiotrichales bacterium 16-46-22]OZB85363.1 MAG: A/G-specific adenine glycosylase [Thiotrichales bacterium 12-47-6]HQT03197.1 A/G-specific adenine glycosylase [Thiotrichales bacterium]
MSQSWEEGSFSERLLAWFDHYGRHDLPWQHPATPYRVWVSEVMLQQTQVATVTPYFERFMAQFPNVDSLASASVDQVLALWSGLGYYARGRNLHKAAQVIVRDFMGQLPNNAAALMSLPGIGQSTAHAILSLAYQQPTAICDGNVKRVLARWLALHLPIESKEAQQRLWQVADELQSRARPGAYTQAIMDLGATLCTRTKPRCEQCPLVQDCAARKSDQTVTTWPLRKAKASKSLHSVNLYCYMSTDGAIWLEAPQQQTGIWGGLHQLPQAPLSHSKESFTPLSPIKHVFTHQVWQITPYVTVMTQKADEQQLSNNGLWYNPNQINQSVARPAVVDKLLKYWALHQGSLL